MRPFLPEGSQIDPRWYSDWGEQFGVPELAGEMARNPRMADRMAYSVFDRMQIDTRASFSEDEIVPVAQYIDDRERLVTLCGLVLNGELIRSQVSRSGFETLLKSFSADDLKIAASLPHLHDSKSIFGIDINRLPALVSRAGEACVATWINGLSEQMQLRLRLLQSEAEQGDGQTQKSKRSTDIVRAVSRRLCGLPEAAA